MAARPPSEGARAGQARSGTCPRLVPAAAAVKVQYESKRRDHISYSWCRHSRWRTSDYSRWHASFTMKVAARVAAAASLAELARPADGGRQHCLCRAPVVPTPPSGVCARAPLCSVAEPRGDARAALCLECAPRAAPHAVTRKSGSRVRCVALILASALPRPRATQIQLLPALWAQIGGRDTLQPLQRRNQP